MTEKQKWLPALILAAVVLGIFFLASRAYAGAALSQQKDDLRVIQELPKHSVGLMKTDDLASLLLLD
ncbi:hypothetical protein ACVRXQ_10285 [Streptococcus panodentis]|uniref:Uncharacterized protein n=2 Tax=Streptococcus panodentis TaxID=1581472 RepID=A0ABS5B031_9STRE|nr:hypothetical protein [Streptococcus sp. DD11]KXT83496.1 hypothetical protein STRDD11_01477 [Streptococcus sp. DD11]MBP2622182.1 hypothetical protein [Streptococcus panodentis]